VCGRRRVIELVVSALDVNALPAQVDIDQVLDRIDLNRLLERVDLNDLVKHIHIEALVARTDLGAIIAARTPARAARQTICGPGRSMTARAGDALPSRPPAIALGEPAREECRLRSAFYRLRRGRGDKPRRVHARPGRHLVRGDGADRQGHHLAPGRLLGDHRLCRLGVHLLRPLLGRERQDRRHGAVRHAGRSRRRRRCRRAPGSRAHAGPPVELPAAGPGLRGCAAG
jgi:hypothetical protein